MRIVACCFLAALVAAAGCMDAHGLALFKRPAKSAPPGNPPAARPRPPVTADEVTETNGHAKSQALNEELDREAASGIQQTAAKSCPSGH
jgi:hypothetical protein